MNFDFKENYTVSDLVEIVKILRSEQGCPWDRQQTHQSIRNDLLEEAYEAADAIDRNSDIDMCEEFGDLLLQVVFHCVLAQEQGSFDLDIAADGICKKLILRHPHVFGDVVADTAEKVLDNWDKIKMVEKQQNSFTDTLKSVPAAFPALMRAQKLQKRAAKAGFDWEDIQGPLSKIEEELGEVKQAVESGDKQEISDEISDLLFSCVNVARFAKIDSEQALYNGCEKFIRRFEAVEHKCDEIGCKMNEMSADKLDTFWKEVKLEERF